MKKLILITFLIQLPFTAKSQNQSECIAQFLYFASKEEVRFRSYSGIMKTGLLLTQNDQGVAVIKTPGGTTDVPLKDIFKSLNVGVPHTVHPDSIDFNSKIYKQVIGRELTEFGNGAARLSSTDSFRDKPRLDQLRALQDYVLQASRAEKKKYSGDSQREYAEVLNLRNANDAELLHLMAFVLAEAGFEFNFAQVMTLGFAHKWIELELYHTTFIIDPVWNRVKDKDFLHKDGLIEFFRINRHYNDVAKQVIPIRLENKWSY